MEEILIKYNQLNPSARESFLDFLDFLVQKQHTKQVVLESRVEEDEWLVLANKMGDETQKRGLTQEILDEIINEKIEKTP
jgi:hypothetical protein